MTHPIELAARLDRHPRVVFRELGDGEGGVLLHLVTGQYYGLNVTGALIWSLLDGRRTLEEIVAEIRTRVKDAPAGLAEDVMGFIGHLRERALVDIMQTGAAPDGQEQIDPSMTTR